MRYGVRYRLLAALAFVVTVVLGLLSRSRYVALPAPLSKDAGDALWALAVYWVARGLAPRLTLRTSALVALTFAFCIEFSQFYQAPWIDRLRARRLGGLILGYGFHASDLLCYAVGVGVGVLIEAAVRRAVSTGEQDITP